MSTTIGNLEPKRQLESAAKSLIYAFNGGSPLKSVMARLNPNVRIPVVLKWPSTV